MGRHLTASRQIGQTFFILAQPFILKKLVMMKTSLLPFIVEHVATPNGHDRVITGEQLVQTDHAIREGHPIQGANPNS